MTRSNHRQDLMIQLTELGLDKQLFAVVESGVLVATDSEVANMSRTLGSAIGRLPSLLAAVHRENADGDKSQPLARLGIDERDIGKSFASATGSDGSLLRKVVFDTTLAALSSRELTLKNIRTVLASIAKDASAGAARNANAGVDVESLLDMAVAGMDDALVKAVEANRVALQQFVAQGADLRERHLKKALTDLDKMEDTFIGALKKATEAANAQVGKQWAPVLERLQVSGTLSGAQAANAAEQIAGRMQTAMRDSRAAGLRAAQILAESYAALVSGVLLGMADATAKTAVSTPTSKTDSNNAPIASRPRRTSG